MPQAGPDHGKGHYNLGVLLIATRRQREAETHLRQALLIEPGSAEVRYQLAQSLLEQKQYSEAASLLHEVIARQPEDATALDSLSYAYLNMGQADQAVAHGRTAVKLAPENHLVLSNLLFTLNYADIPLAEVTDRARAYGRMVSAKAAGLRMPPRVRETPAKLRIGFVSGDFRDHPVTQFLLPLLDAIGRRRVRGLDR